MMVSRIKNILLACRNMLPALLLMLPLLTGCRSNNDVPDITTSGQIETEDDNVTLDLSIGINGGGNQGTRAFDDNDDNTFEHPVSSYEIVNTLRVVIVRLDVEQADGTKKNIIEHNRMVNVSPEYADNDLNLITSYYVLHDNLRFNLIGGEMKTIYLFANEEMVRDQQRFDFTNELKVGKEFPKDRVENLLIQREEKVAYIDNVISNSDNDEDKKRTHNVPMSEAFNIYVPAPRGYGEDLYSQTLFLTRSLIKFSFSITFDKGDLLNEDWAQIQNLGMKLSGVKISNLANSSYYLPRDTKYNPWKYWPEPATSTYFDLTPKPESDQPVLPAISTDERRITDFGVPENPGASEYVFKFEQPIRIVKEGTGKVSHVAPAIYLPESKVTGEGEDKYYVSLIFDDESLNDQYAPVPLQGIDALQTLTKDIPRNTHMKVNMVMNLKKHELEATVTLFPYTAVSLNPEFGFGVPVEDVKITTEGKPEVAEGQTISLVGYVTPEDANNKDITWTSADPGIATVSEDGTVTGVNADGINEGKKVVITATSVDNPKKFATCEVTVTPKIKVTEIELKPSEWEGNVDETINLEASITPNNATNKNLIWESADKSIAEVSSYGTVKAVNPGTTTITATSPDDEEVKATCTVKVKLRKLVSGITLSPTSLSIREGAQSSLTATVSPQDATNQDLKWTSSNPDIATVSSYGLVTAIKTGTTTITAAATDGSGKLGECEITVTSKTPITSISLNRTTLTLRETQKGTLTATVSPNNATYKENFVWTSDNPYIATATGTKPTGTVTAVTAVEIQDAPGTYQTATITATSVEDPTKFATCVVTVLPAIQVEKIDITRTADGIVTSWPDATKGETKDIRATIVPSDATNKEVVWTSSDENVATISRSWIDTTSTDAAKKGTSIAIIEAKGKGIATITVTSVANPKVLTTYEVIVN